jgi:hypothetical protein
MKTVFLIAIGILVGWFGNQGYQFVQNNHPIRVEVTVVQSPSPVASSDHGTVSRTASAPKTISKPVKVVQEVRKATPVRTYPEDRDNVHPAFATQGIEYQQISGF